jgi:hypothetical protein
MMMIQIKLILKKKTARVVGFGKEQISDFGTIL